MKVASTRIALNSLRREKRYKRQDDEDLIHALSDSVDPELQELRDLYRPLVKRSVEAAFAALIPSDRELLRSYIIERLTLTELAKNLQVGVTTAHRRLRAVRERLAKLTRRFVTEDRDMSPSECASVIRLAESGFHLSVDRLLAGDGGKDREGPP